MSPVRTRLAALRRKLPQGQRLPERAWCARHQGIIALLWAHAAAIPVFALVRGFSVRHAVAEGAVVPLAAIVAMSQRLDRRTRTVAASLGLLSSSAILVHLSGGVIEMHFHFFVMVAVVALYQDWVPFLAAIGYVFVHHGLMGVLDPNSVYNHLAGQTHPWRWAAIHAVFISGISIACVVTWQLNEHILAEQQETEDRLREESQIVETLHFVGQTLAAELDTHRVLQTVTDGATTLTGAGFGAFFYNVENEAGESYLLYTLSGAPMEAFDRFGLPRNTEVFAPTFAGEGVVRLDDVTADPRYGKMAPHYGMPAGHLPVRSYLAVPVRSRTGEVLGGLFFGHPQVARFTEVDERIVVGIASQAAIALDNARLYELERLARTASDAARTRLALLAEASKVMASSLEVETVLRDFARLVVPAIADRCLVDLVREDGMIERVAAIGDDDTADLSTIVAPLVGRHEELGALTLATTDPARTPLGDADVSFVEDLARRAAVAIENAQLYARQRTVAETLQHSLLPERLPQIPGLLTAARYLAGGPGVEIGGDWYDVMQLRGGRIGLAIGDVVGRGERAAALMGQLRSALRAYAMEGHSPAELMGRLNAMLVEAGTEQMATVLYAVLDPETGELCYANAGHPPPLVTLPDGTATFLEDGRGVPVGALPGARYTEAVAHLAPSQTVVLYTDGLVEDRTSPIDEGLGRLRDAVLAAPEDLDLLCAQVVREALGDRESHDDAALLAVRLIPLGDRLHLRLPAHPNVLGPLRATMRRWLAGAGASATECDELLVASGELFSNAIRHASGPARSHFDVYGDRGGEVTISVRDPGRWREARPGVSGGRGLAIVEAYSDQVDVITGPAGTEVRMRRKLAAR